MFLVHVVITTSTQTPSPDTLLQPCPGKPCARSSSKSNRILGTCCLIPKFTLGSCKCLSSKSPGWVWEGLLLMRSRDAADKIYKYGMRYIRFHVILNKISMRLLLLVMIFKRLASICMLAFRIAKLHWALRPKLHDARLHLFSDCGWCSVKRLSETCFTLRLFTTNWWTQKHKES